MAQPPVHHVRGVDDDDHVDAEERPERDLDPAAVARHAALMKRRGEILYRRTAAERFR